MGLFGFVISMVNEEDLYFLTTTLWNYNMLTIRNTWNALYYGSIYGWKFRDKILKKLKKLMEKKYIKLLSHN